ncbi:hypothetical protein SAMN00768000_0758 [Sulfobacillus thermosulfidooxidans DSM 9293]|uniref:Uncharacterized protein n=1 Tax=Sulfobacillus thermosulfidooxidans (strain DSM 9293 / VKM B-1269 / AT-1) TaxID=929705 RepID=A0A1W1W989_SULTA|nr:hypothetical protein [Sulfobacillus thermosulfidooxidans]SMC02772.1 hypothetical protein SAMN00768000_0758 [Sulfobacillus thermosulfidooxidans DSM 9293]
MGTDNQKVLVYIGRIAQQNPLIQTIIGYLMADPSRTRFVYQLKDEYALSMTMSIHRRIEIPLAPWQGFIRGVPVPDPLTWIQAAQDFKGQPIMVRLSTDDPVLLQLLNTLLKDEKAQEYRNQLLDRMESVRKELDRALDLYNEVRHIMEIDHERQPELIKFLAMAEDQMQGMGQELKTLKAHLENTQSSSWPEGSDE